MSRKRHEPDRQLHDQDEKLTELRREVNRIEAAQERSDALRILNALERIQQEHKASMQRLADARRRLRFRVMLVVVLALLWVAIMVTYHV
ncbi:MAG: hypothetical protein GWO02_01345 [Gammaproteobacteria bacterium]|nr:hypothetical protein [Gammaproteobacteria bacterium]